MKRRIQVCKSGVILGLTGVLVAAALPSHAVIAQRFVHSTEADFEPGEFEGTAVTTLGDLELAPTTALLAELPTQYTVIYDVVELDGVTYVAAGPEGAVFKVVERQEAEAQAAEDAEDDADASSDADTDDAEVAAMSVEEILSVPGEQVFDLVTADGVLVAAVSSGDDSRLIKLDTSGQGEHETVMSVPETRYLWDVLHLPEAGVTFAATGTEGRIVRLDASGDEPTVEVVLDTPQANILTLAGTPDEDGSIGFPVYAGTDTDGLIYRIDEDGSSRAIYDAAEPEVAALIVAKDGTLYAGTADANQAKPGRMDGANEEDTGRPDGEALEDEDQSVIPDDEPELPELPADPVPMQGDPESGASSDAIDIVEDAAAADSVLDDDSASMATPEIDEPADLDPEGEPADVETTQSAEISPQQYDALRDEVKRRLAAAAKGGKLAAGGKSSASQPKATRARTAGSPKASAKEGNAVYRISPEGLVTEAFRESVMVLGLHLDEQTPGGRLLIATGSEGQLYEVKLDTQEAAVLADLDAEQVYRVAPGSDGTTILATANPATLRTLTQADASSGGAYTSAALDAEQISLWGKLLVALDRGPRLSVTVQTRSGAVADPDAAAWSPWEKATPTHTDLESKLDTGLALYEIASPPARFIQYRLQLGSKLQGDLPTPAIDRVELAYVRPNLAPSLTSLTAAYGETPDDPDKPTPTVVKIEWEASDPNGDRLRFDIHAQPITSSDAELPGGWLTVAEDLDESPFEWNTKTMPDGRYILRVVAHDRLDNPAGSARAGSRRSAPLVIDNSPPALELTQTTAPSRTDRGVYTGSATDATSPLLAVEFRIADDEPWRPALPDDLIYDSTTEAFTFTLPRLVPGGHVLSIRARDTRGNVAYQSHFLTVE